MATQDHHGHNGSNVDTDVDADAALRTAFKRIHGQSQKSPDKEAYEFVRSKCPALSSDESQEKYSNYNDIWGFGNLIHMHAVIEADDLPAMRELIQIEPDLLRCEWPGDLLCSPMVLAARLSRHAILDILMKHRTTLPPEMRAPPEYDDDDEHGTWGTPLTEACAMGRLDTVRLLLQGMPDTDINEVSPNGFTPLLAAAHGHSGPPEARVELIRYLLERGADIHAVMQSFLAFCETLDKEYDESLEDGPFVLRPRPGGDGNALALALKSSSTVPAVVAVLVEAGVSVYQSYLGMIAPIDRTDGQDVHRYDHYTFDRVYFSPIATGARHHNVEGVKALLDLCPADHDRLLATTDAVLVPQPPAPLRDPDDEVPVLLPLHAAVIGSWRTGFPWTPDSFKAAVDMVRLLTVDKAICAATINARYRRHYTALHMATSFDRMPLMLALVELGADIEVLPRRNGRGIILALFSSVSRISRSSYIQFSPELAVNVDASTDVMAVLTKLLERYSPRGEDTQVDAQNAAIRIALVNEADANGNTPLHFAMAYCMPRSTAALLALGARADVANNAGQVPYTPPPGQQHSF